MPRRRRRHPVEILPEMPLIGVDLGQSRLLGYFLNDYQCGVIPCPTGRRYMTNPSPSKHSSNQYSVQNFNQYLNHWKLVRRKVYLESNRQKWKIIQFDNRRQKERLSTNVKGWLDILINSILLWVLLISLLIAEKSIDMDQQGLSENGCVIKRT
ncbi:hypothetical protein P9112_000770 [Eukaryota sp. TZLM1-RC]